MSNNIQATRENLKLKKWRQSFSGTAKLTGRTLTQAIDLPGLREPVRAARDIATALKVPKKNDIKAQELEGRIDDTLSQIKTAFSAENGNVESEEWRKRYQAYCEAIRKLEGIKTELGEIKSQTFTAKLMRQDDIELFLGKKDHESHGIVQKFNVS